MTVVGWVNAKLLFRAICSIIEVGRPVLSYRFGRNDAKFHCLSMAGAARATTGRKEADYTQSLRLA